MQHIDVLIAFAVVMLGVSLLITILTQMLSALAGSRGTNLRWGLIELIKTVDPNLEAQAGPLADKVLTHSLISDSSISSLASKYRNNRVFGRLLSRMHLASAIRVEELTGILRIIARSSATTAPPRAVAAAAGAGGGSVSSPSNTADTTSANEIAQAAGSLLAKFEDPIAVSQTMPPVLGSIRSLIPENAQSARELVDRLADTGEKRVLSLDTWFNTAMDRVKQRFAMNMRIYTVIFAIVLAFAMQIDAIRLFNQLSSDSTLRAKLVENSAAMSKLSADFGNAMTTPTDGTAQPAKDEDRQKLENLANEARKVENSLAASGFQLLPASYHATDFQDMKHVLGIVIAAALLSLGAPFWFNALKTLCSLLPSPSVAKAAD
jgi:hypothetical protein